ncbi:MAG: phospholipid carrier-dependent glycosyltransferase [Croceibacterium sp.]
MSVAPVHARDPIGWTVALSTLFAGLCAVRLTIPSTPLFDEVHYLPAARAIIALSHSANAEHPPLGKELIALGIVLFGDRPLGWRIMALAFGTLGLFSAMRALWFASGSRFASLAVGVLLITGFPLLLQSRIAMLDGFMLGLTLAGLWHLAGAVRENETAHWRLPLSGVLLGLAMAAKWNAIPVAVLPGLAFLAVRLRHAGWRSVTVRRGPPIGNITLWQAALSLGLVPLIVYAAAFWPLFMLHQGATAPSGLITLHREMFNLQAQPLPAHPYQSQWWQWVIDQRSIWYLYERIDGAQRGVVMLGNPLTMGLGLPALAWCAWAGIRHRRNDALALVVLYAASLALFIVAPKNVQFYYHYALPSCFLLGALALALAELVTRGWRGISLAVLTGSVAMFIYFWPILTAAPLANDRAFEDYTWLDSWR